MWKSILKKGGYGLFFVFLAACSPDKKPQIERPLGEIYHQAFGHLKEGEFEKAADEFDEVERQYPYSAWSVKAQLMSAYASYREQKFDRAIGTLDSFIALHPYHSQVSYAYYLRALCYYDDIVSVTKDAKVAESALAALTEVLNRFPDTCYGQDAAFKKDYVLGHLAGKEMSIGRFYLYQQDYIAAFRRFQNVLTHYLRSAQTPEALHRLVECSVALGLKEEAQRNAAILGHNFPKNSWYAETYLLLKGEDLRLASSAPKNWISRLF